MKPLGRGLLLIEATAYAIARGLCVRHGDLVLRPIVVDYRLFYIVGDGLMPVTSGWIPSALAMDIGWQVVDEDGDVVGEDDLVRLEAIA